MARCDPIPHLPEWNPPVGKAVLAVYDEVTGQLRPLRFKEAFPGTGLCTSLNPTSKEIEGAYYEFYLRLVALEKLYCTCTCAEPPEPTPTPTPTPTSTPNPLLVYYSSVMYPVRYSDSLDLGHGNIVKESVVPQWNDEVGLSLTSIESGDFSGGVVSYNNWAPEQINLTLAKLLSGEFIGGVKFYEGLPESINLSTTKADSGTMTTQLISYQNWVVEGVNMGTTKLVQGEWV